MNHASGFLPATSEESYFKALADAMPQIVWTSEHDGMADYFNQRWCDYIGFTPTPKEGSCWDRMIHPDERERVLGEWERCKSLSIPFEVEYRLRKHDGTYRWHLDRAVPLRDETGRVIRWFGTSTDIEDQKRAQAMLSLLAEAGTVFGASLERDSILEAVGKLMVPEFADLCWVELTDPQPSVVVRASDPDAQRKVEEAMRMRRSGPRGVRQEALLLKTLDSESLLLAAEGFFDLFRCLQELKLGTCVKVPLQSARREVGTATFFRMAHRTGYSEGDRELFAQLGAKLSLAIDNARLFSEARRSTEIRDEYISVISHELKNPLAALSSLVELAERVLRPDTGAASVRAQGLLAKCKYQGRRIDQLLNGFRDVTRIESGLLKLNPGDSDLVAIVREVVQNSAETGRSPVVFKGVEKLEGFWDGARLEQILVHLLANAQRYGEGKPIHVELSGDEFFASLVVRDQGIGIAAADQARIFQRFERLGPKLRSAGLGLGLFIVRQIAEAHGGCVLVESAVGQGSAFVVKIPRKLSPLGTFSQASHFSS